MTAQSWDRRKCPSKCVSDVIIRWVVTWPCKRELCKYLIESYLNWASKWSAWMLILLNCAYLNPLSSIIQVNFCSIKVLIWLIKELNLDVRMLTKRPDIDHIRSKIYSSLDDYCRQKYPNEDGRFAQLLLRLPALRSISLKCLDHLFYFQLIDEKHIEVLLTEEINQCT